MFLYVVMFMSMLLLTYGTTGNSVVAITISASNTILLYLMYNVMTEGME